MDWWDKSIIKSAFIQGLVATGVTAITLSIVDKSSLSTILLLSVFGAVSFGDIVYSYYVKGSKKQK